MGRSRIPGSRSFIRGQVGEDIYTIGRAADGRMQQNVRSKPEYVVQANTDDQIKARMIFSQIYAASHHFADIIDHSWEGVPYGQPSVSKFVRLNRHRLASDMVDNWDESYQFGWQLKGNHEICSGPWIVSEGSLPMPDSVSWFNPWRFGENVFWQVLTRVGSLTYGQLKAAFDFAAGDYFTFFCVSVREDNYATRLHLMRYILSDKLSDDTILNAMNVYQAFEFEGTEEPIITMNQDLGWITFQIRGRDTDGTKLGWGCSGLILSKQVNGVWCRSNCVLQHDPDFINGVSPHKCFDSWVQSYSE